MYCDFSTRFVAAGLAWLGAAASSLAATPAPASVPAPASAPLKLHLPSPDWRDQVMYFVLTDRFDDGDASNNDQGAGEFDPRSKSHYNGGDLVGLQRRLDYIRGLGVTALWITPPVANQWWDGQVGSSGYHGYWAENFMQVDKHLGTLDDYKALSHALHSRGMFLVQDIVLNHTGNFFGYGPGWTAADPARDYRPNTASQPLAAPSQPPFDQNDPRQSAQRAAAIYHWTPDVGDYQQPHQLLNWQMSGLDDLNTANPVVQRALRASYGHWIREVGVDAFRIDTAFYLPPDFFAGFLHSTDPQAPGMARVARDTGRRGFFSFGEGFAVDKPMAVRAAQRIERYVRSPQGAPLLPGMLNFPLYGSLGDVLARGAPAAVLGHRIGAMMRSHSAPQLMPSFVDNHDVDRFLAGGSEAGLRQALLTIMTLPGIPVIYYGTEQGFTEQRGAMFAAGQGSGGRDRFDADHPLYRSIARLTQLRRAHPLFSRGKPRMLQASPHGPGVLAWRMQQGRDAALVVLNTADTPVLMHHLATGLPAGVTLTGLLALDGEPAALRTGAGGLINAELPARSGQVWRLPASPIAAPPGATRAPGQAIATLAVTQARVMAEGMVLHAAGRAPAGSALHVLINGALAHAQALHADKHGHWQARLPIGHLAESEGLGAHRLLAWQAATGQVSAARPFTVRRPWRLLVDQSDPAGDDQGPDGQYRYPTDPSWAEHRQMDLRRAQVWRSGQRLKIELTLAGMTQSWNPPNGFDHVVFSLHFSQRGRSDGIAELPLQDARLPDGALWQHRLRVGGWSNALFSANGAGALSEGRPLASTAVVEVDVPRRLLRLILPAGALGDTADLVGLELHINTWDYDGGYRALAPLAGPFTLGGGPPDGPKLMDQMRLQLP